MIEPTCTEAAPCFACLRCFVALTNTLATDPNVRAHMTGIETRPAWEPAWKHAAEANGLLPSADAYRVGPLSTERTITLTAAHVATLPTGERVELPAGTVLREGTGAIDHRHLLACARGVVDHDAAQALTGPVAHALISALRAACGDSIEDVAVRAGLPREMAPSATPIIDAWRAAGEPAAMTFTAEEAARLTGIAAIFPEPSCAPPHTVREEDDTGVRFADRSQAMADRNKRALETWNITAHESHLPDPPIGSGCLVYDCWTPCAPGHHHCARHGGADAVPPPSKPRT